MRWEMLATYLKALTKQFKGRKGGAGEMAKQVRASAALPGNHL